MDPPTILAVSQLIASLAALVASVGAVIVSMRNAVKIEQVHIATNSMKDALVTSEGKVQRAEGVKEGAAAAAVGAKVILEDNKDPKAGGAK